MKKFAKASAREVHGRAMAEMIRKGGKRRVTARAFILLLPALAACFAAAFGYQRYARVNFGVVVPQKVYRSAQPSPADLSRWARELGIKSVLNLRDDAPGGGYGAEIEAAEKLGVTFLHLPLRADRAPAADRLGLLIRYMQRAQKPLLIHCRAGADRTGAASVIAAMCIGGEPYKKARKQLSILHLRLVPDSWGIGGLLTAFERHAAETGLEDPTWSDFAAWAAQNGRPGPGA